MKKFNYIFRKTIILICLLAIILTNFSPFAAYAVDSKKENITYLSDLLSAVELSAEDFVYLSDLWNTDKLLKKESSWKDARALKINENEPGNMISLLIDGEKTYFLNGIFAHANSTVIFDISEYTKKGYDIFSTYLGVDTYAASNGNGVKFTISASVDGENYTTLKTTEIFKGVSNAEKVSLSIEGYKYLKLYADGNGNNGSDHSVYADAMIYNSKTYTPKESTNIEWIKRLSEYDKDLLNKNIDDIVKDSNLRLELLQRTLVSRVDYYVLQAWTKANSDNEAALEWLFKDVNRLEEYILGGNPLGGNYIKSLTIISDIYKKHKEDFTSTYGSTFQKLMFATSLTHSSEVSSWFAGANGARVYSTPLGRYEAIKELFIGAAEKKNWEQTTNDGTVVPYTFKWEQFQDLTVEEMRWVTDTKLSDEEFLWLNWYATITKMGKTQYSGMNNGNGRGELNPYTYINYGNGGNVGRDDYYTSNPKCGVGNEFYDKDKRTSDCYDKYQLDNWEGLRTTTKAKPTLWIAFEEDGVCGTLMHVGVNLEGVFGTPAEGLGQPGHGAYIYANREYSEAKKRYITKEWNTYNWVSNWDQSEKGERLLLNWGTRDRSTVFSSTYNLIYIPLAQKAINDYENYRISELYMLIAEVKTDNSDKENCYKKALDYIPYHITAWYKLLTSKVTNTPEAEINASELSKLGKQMMNAVGNAPIAIDELSNIINKYLGNEEGSYKLSRYNILKALTNASAEYMNAGGVKAVANRLLGNNEGEAPATFSFDDNILKISFGDAFYYALDYKYDPSTKNVTATWIEVVGTQVDLTNKLSKITAEDDIAIYLVGDSPNNSYIIDITETNAPANLYANDLENKVIGATNTMEWKHANTNEAWTPFTDNTKFDGVNSILVRYGAHGTSLASESVGLTFELDPEADPTKVYIPISRLSAIASSQQNNNEAAIKAIDGHAKTYWHNRWDGNDKERWIRIEITDGPVELSKIDYLPRQDSGTNGIFTKAKIEVSLTGNDDWKLIDDNVVWGNNKSQKSYIFDTPTLAKYVRITALNSVGNFASAAMINLYENTVRDTISVNDLNISYITSGYVYNGEEKKPAVTVKDGVKELINGEHYTIEYIDNINAGTGKIILRGLGIYDGTRTLEFSISKAKEPSIVPNKEMVATSKQNYLRDIVLPESWVWLEPNTKLNAGNTINAITSYNGNDKENYETTKLNISVTKEKGTSPKVTLKEEKKLIFDISKEEAKSLDFFKSLVEITDEEDDYNKLDIKVDASDWNNNWTNVGTYNIIFTVTDTDKNVTSFTLEFTLIDGENTKVEIDKTYLIKIDKTNLEYTGSELKPNVSIVDSNNHTLKLGTDYKIKYSNNVNAGTALITMTGNGIYSGEINKEFTIKKASIPPVIPDERLSVSSNTSSLSEIHLPNGWRWEDETIKLHDGENILKIIYSGDVNHESYTMEIKVIKGYKPSVDESNNNPGENKNPQNPDVSGKPSNPSNGASSGSSSPSKPSSSTNNNQDGNSSGNSDDSNFGGDDNNNDDNKNNEESKDGEEKHPNLKDDKEDNEFVKSDKPDIKRIIIVIGCITSAVIAIGTYLVFIKRRK